MREAAAHGHFMDRVFTAEERAWAAGRGAHEAASLAGMWAAKDALAKALGTGVAFPLTDAGIGHTAEGAPFYALTGRPAALCEGFTLSLSVTHEGDTAAAVCVMLKMNTD